MFNLLLLKFVRVSFVRAGPEPFQFTEDGERAMDLLAVCD